MTRSEGRILQYLSHRTSSLVSCLVCRLLARCFATLPLRRAAGDCFRPRGYDAARSVRHPLGGVRVGAGLGWYYRVPLDARLPLQSGAWVIG